MTSERSDDAPNAPSNPGPREAMRARRPSLFSDTVAATKATLSKTVFEYHLNTLTSRKQEYEFEHFGRKLAEKELCPNLRPQTGPTGGGDSKVDTETYPVAAEIAERWWMGEPAAGKERWGFAFSAKKAWKPKATKDVVNIHSAGRNYDLIYFGSNQFISDKKRAEAEDELSKLGVPVRILDRTWLVEAVFEKDHVDLAIATLQIDGGATTTQKPGPLDTRRTADLEALDREIADPANYASADYQLAEDCLEAALLARGLGRTRAEIEGRFAQAERIAKKINYRQQLMRIAYTRAWTAFWWFEDFDEFYRFYIEVEGHLDDAGRSADLERLVTLWHLLAGEHLKPSAATTVDVEERTRRLTEVLQAAIDDRSRPNNALQAKSQLWQVQTFLALKAGDQAALETGLVTLRSIVADSAQYGAFPIERLAKIVREVGNVVDSPAFDIAYEEVVEAVRRRTSDGEAGQAYNDRGLQKLKQDRPYEAIKWFGKAEALLTSTTEHRGALNIALMGASNAYQLAGLLWAARNKNLVAVERSLVPFNEDGEMAGAALPCLQRLVWYELQLGRVPHVLAAMSLARFVELHLKLTEERVERLNAERQGQEVTLGIHMLSLPLEGLHEASRFPDVLERLGLTNARLALLWSLGQLDAIKTEGYFGEEDPSARTAWFEEWQDEAAADLASRPPNLLASERTRFTSVILGARIVADTPVEPVGLALAESVLGALEAFMATSNEDDVMPHREETIVTLRGGLPRGEGLKTSYDLETGAFTVDYPAEIEFSSGADMRAHLSWLRDAVAMIASRSFMVRDPKTWLDRLSKDENVFNRAVTLGDMLTLGRNVFGFDPQVTLPSWGEDDDKVYSVLRDKPWRVKSDGDPAKDDAGPAGFAEGAPPDEFYDLATLRHDQRTVFSPIETGLWDAAKWTAAFFAELPDQPPVLGLGFKDARYASAILDGWIRRWGNVDEKEDLRIAIITGVSRRNPTHYIITVGPNISRPVGDQKHFFMIVRRCTMTPQTLENLDNFLKLYAQYGAYYLATSGLYDDAAFDPARLILKAQLDVKAAWQIEPNDPDLGALGDDADPIIPPGETDPPIKRAMALRRQMRDRQRR